MSVEEDALLSFESRRSKNAGGSHARTDLLDSPRSISSDCSSLFGEFLILFRNDSYRQR